MIIDPPVLQATPAFGTDRADRFVIQNLVNETVFDGHGFTPDWKQGLLYADANQACMDMRKIMLRVYDGEPLTRYHAPCWIDVLGKHEMVHVAQWLSRASLLKLRTDDYGNGPHGSLVLPVIHWSLMENVDE